MLVEGLVEDETVNGLGRPQELVGPPLLGGALEGLPGQRIGGRKKVPDIFGAGVQDFNHLRPLFGGQPALPQQAVKGILAQHLHLVVLAHGQFLHLDVRDARLGEESRNPPRRIQFGALRAKDADKLAELLLVHRGEHAEPDQLARVEGVRQGGGRPAGDDGTVHGEGVPPHVHRQGAVRLQVAAQGGEEGFDGQGVSGVRRRIQGRGFNGQAQLFHQPGRGLCFGSFCLGFHRRYPAPISCPLPDPARLGPQRRGKGEFA